MRNQKQLSRILLVDDRAEPLRNVQDFAQPATEIEECSTGLAALERVITSRSRHP
jgi:hypothetical protein